MDTSVLFCLFVFVFILFFFFCKLNSNSEDPGDGGDLNIHSKQFIFICIIYSKNTAFP